MNAPPAFGVIFDLDGTLVDSRDDIVRAVNRTLERHGLPARDGAEIAGNVGDGSRVLLARTLSLDPKDPALSPLLDGFLAYYGEHAADSTTPMPGALEALDALSAAPLAVCTNKPRRATDLVLERLDLARYFRVVVAGGDLPEQKPSPAPIVHIGRLFGVPPSRLVVVGDGVQDVGAGRAAGAKTVAVLGGFGREERLRAARPDVLLASIGELPRVVFEWFGAPA